MLPQREEKKLYPRYSIFYHTMEFYEINLINISRTFLFFHNGLFFFWGWRSSSRDIQTYKWEKWRGVWTMGTGKVVFNFFTRKISSFLDWNVLTFFFLRFLGTYKTLPSLQAKLNKINTYIQSIKPVEEKKKPTKVKFRFISNHHTN